MEEVGRNFSKHIYDDSDDDNFKASPFVAFDKK